MKLLSLMLLTVLAFPVAAELVAISDEGMSEIAGKRSIYLDVYTGTSVGTGSNFSLDPGADGGGVLATENIQILNSAGSAVAPIRVQADVSYDSGAGEGLIALQVSFPEND